MDPQHQNDCCRLCGSVISRRKRKRNIVGEFAKLFETVGGLELLEGDICKSGKAITGPAAKSKTCNFPAEFE